MAEAEELEVVEGPEKMGRVVIRSGPYTIKFVADFSGHAKKAGFTYQGTILGTSFIPQRFYVPAAIRANVILGDRRRQKQNKPPSHSVKFR